VKSRSEVKWDRPSSRRVRWREIWKSQGNHHSGSFQLRGVKDFQSYEARVNPEC
jgi:hypothetical protein